MSEILGQDDIDSLLQQAIEPEAEVEEAVEESVGVIFHEGYRLEGRPLRIEAYDFRNPAFLGEMEMRRLRLMHEEFIRFLEARITLFLRCDFNLKMTQLSTKSYSQVISEVENPTHIALFRAEPLPGVGFIEMSPNLALTVASSILGGKGHAPRLERYLTQIEIDLIEEFLGVVLEEWCTRWDSDSGSLEPTIVGHENMANVLQICEHDTVMFSLSMDATLRGANGRIGICVPLYMIEEPVRQLNAKPGNKNDSGIEKKNPAWRSMYSQILINAEANFSIGEYTVREVLEWEVGTVIPFSEDAMENVTLNLADLPLFTCEAGVDEDLRAVKIKGKVKKEESIWQMKN